MSRMLLRACVLLCAAALPARAHRIDEYLQATTITVEKDRVRLELRLIPGSAVFPIVFAAIDVDSNHVISMDEQRAYAERVLRDLSLTIDDQRVNLWLISSTFPQLGEMQEGQGAIRLEIEGDVPTSGHNRRLLFDNHHLRPISAYLVNSLVPNDSAIRLAAQKRDYTQSSYQLDYVQAGVGASSVSLPMRAEYVAWLGAAVLLLIAYLGPWERPRRMR